MPKRIQRKRTKGWKLPPNTVCVTRPGRWGNPFYPGSRHMDSATPTREECVERFRRHLAFMAQALPVKLAGLLEPLRGKDLACWCAVDNQPCHADVWLALANSPPLRLRAEKED